jgi:outer membrane lipoprotein-sorting protein
MHRLSWLSPVTVEPPILEPVNAPPILQRHPALRWLVPIGIACIAGFAATGFFRSGSTPKSLPDTSPTALIAAVQSNDVSGFSGTVVSHLSLGLPQLPSLSGADEDASFGALLSGSHTMQVWYGGTGKQRVALLGATEETDLFRNGRNMWQWSSVDGVALHTVLPKRGDGAAANLPAAPTALSPMELARRMLQAMDPSTKVSVDSGQTVADRSAYELVLTPRTAATKVGSVHIEVDGATKVPLGVQVYPRGSGAAAIDVAFTNIQFGPQAPRNFVFNPPPNAQVREVRTPAQGASGGDRTLPFGSGWTAVGRFTPGKAALGKYLPPALLDGMTPVSGRWGKGRLLDLPLGSVLVTDDGRVLAGAVQPAQLYAAAAAK